MTQQTKTEQQKKSSHRWFRYFFITVLVIILFMGAGVSAVGWYVMKNLKPTASSAQAKKVVIPNGVTPKKITQILQNEGIIRNATVFYYYLKYKHQGDRFKAGQYAMTPGITLNQIITKLNDGDVIPRPTLKVTIPEGYTLEQIAEKLTQEKLISDPKQFIQLADTRHDFTLKELTKNPQNSKVKHPLEGYLFPDTYAFKTNVTDEQIIQRMMSELDVQLDQLPKGWEQQLTQLGVNFQQMMTIASLIEREVIVDKERPLVASVIYNRLNDHMPLQIDATIQYALDKPKPRLLDKDLKIKTPYNTYIHQGLPPGPIANPSLKSIKAALYPAKTDYLYYVTKKDGSHEQLFAKTYAQHLRNIAKSKQFAEQADTK